MIFSVKWQWFVEAIFCTFLRKPFDFLFNLKKRGKFDVPYMYKNVIADN